MQKQQKSQWTWRDHCLRTGFFSTSTYLINILKSSSFQPYSRESRIEILQ